jgi:phage-related protein
MAVGRVDVTVDADTRTFEAQLVAAGHRAGRLAGKRYGDTFCKEASKRVRRCLDKSIAGTDKQFGKAGDKSGKAFAGKFGSGLTKRMRLILGAIVALAEPLAAIIQGAAGAFTALAGSLYKAVSAGGALIPILAGMGASLGAVVIGSQGMGTAFKAISTEWKDAAASGRKFNMQSKEIQKALKTLTPSARKTAEAFGRMQKPLDDLRRSVQEALFKGMADVLDRISKKILPEVSAGFTKMATSANGFAKGFVTMLEGFDLSKLIGDLAPTMDRVYAALTNFSSGFLTFISAATPAAEALAGRFQKMSESFKQMVEDGKESGAINDFLMTAQTHMSAWWSLIRGTGGALNTLMKAGEQFGLEMVRSLDGVIREWNAWMQTTEGQTSLERFFTMARDSMLALKPILVGLRDAFTTLVTPEAIDRLASISESIGSVLPVIAQLLSIIAQTGVIDTFFAALAMVGEAIQPLMPLFTELAGIISGTLGSILPIIGQAFKDIVTAVQPLLAALMPLIATLLPALVEAFTPIIDVIVQVVSAIAKGLTPIIEALTPIIAELAPVIVAAFVAFNPFLRILTVLGPVVAAIAEPLGKLVAWFIRLIEPIVPLIAGIAKLIFEFIAFNKVFGLIGQVIGKVIGWFKGAGTAISGFGNTVKTVFQSIGQIIGGIVNVFKIVGQTIAKVFGQLIMGYIQSVIAVWKALWNAISTGASFISNAIKSIVGFFESLYLRVLSVFDGVKGIFTGFKDAIVGVFETIYLKALYVFDAIKTFIVNFVTSIIIRFNGIIDAVQGVWTSITNGVVTAFNFVKGFISGVIDFIKGLFGSLAGMMGNIWGNITSSISSAMNSAKTAVSSQITAIINIFKGIPGKVKNAIASIVGVFGDVMRDAYNKVKEWIGKITGAFSNMWSSVKSKIPFFAAGGITTGPSIVGEAGPEMVIPLTRPLSQVDPSVRAIAAMLRGQGGGDQVVAGGSTGPTKIVNNSIKVYAPSADPEAVAAQVVNRSVAMAM